MLTNTTQLKLIPALLIFSIFIFEMATDLYLPNLPEMAIYFSVKENIVQLTLSAYLFGFSIPGCFFGPLSDSIGRRKIILIGLIVFALGSMSCWMAQNIYPLIISRLIQGIGAGITCVVGTAVIKDLFDDIRCSRIFSSMGTIIALSPMIAPICGGIIADIWNWHYNFSIIAFAGILPAVSAYWLLSESLPSSHRHSFSAKKVFHTYSSLITKPCIMGYCLISGLTYGGLWVWIAETPFYTINKLGINASHYGYYAAIGPAAYILGAFINRQLVVKYHLTGMLRLGLIIMITGNFLLVGVSYWFDHSLAAIYAALIIYGIGLAPVFANAATLSVDVPPNQRGAASALLSTTEMACAAATTFIIGRISDQTLVPVTSSMLICSLMCLGLFWFLSSSKTESKESSLA